MTAFSWPQRVELWDRALAFMRAYFRQQGLREVTTANRVRAPAVEPYIEPIPSSGKYLATSPELAMKRLLCRGSGPIFQISHVFRAAEQGSLHCEEFHLLEWYRLLAADAAYLPLATKDVEEIVMGMFAALGQRPPPRSWQQVSALDLIGETMGLFLRGDEDGEELLAQLNQHPLARFWHLSCESPPIFQEVAALKLWTEFFTLWSDQILPRWLQDKAVEGLHICEFPARLAALSERREQVLSNGILRTVACRFESYVFGIELANGYKELRDAEEQRHRFVLANELRGIHGQQALPIHEPFIADLRQGLPNCVGVALGVDRLVMLAAGAAQLSDVIGMDFYD